MFIASEKRKENIAEYLLYMWSVEELIRANSLDIDQIRTKIIEPMCLDPEKEKTITEWYESLIDMMRSENVVSSGHLQINKNVIIQLVQLHQALLADPKFTRYSAEFYNTLPYIVDLRSKAGENKVGEIETCFTALYGMLMLRLKKTEISEATQKAVGQISRFLALLAHYFKLDDNNELKFSDND